MKALLALVLAAPAVAQAPPPPGASAPFPVTVGVDARAEVGEMRPIWRFFGYDEPNFTYMRDGQRLLGELVLNVFRMLGKMGGKRLAVTSSADPGVEAMRRAGVRGQPDVAGLASLEGRRLSVLLWHYHDDDVAGPAAEQQAELVRAGRLAEADPAETVDVHAGRASRRLTLPRQAVSLLVIEAAL